MPEVTLLEYVQDILSALDSDEVDSITDTVESLQVARIVKRSYDQIVTRADLHEHYTLFELLASGSASKPVLMYRPDDVSSIMWVKYNVETADDTNTNFVTIPFLPINEFLARMHMLAEDADNVLQFDHTVNSDSITILCEDDRAPTYWTTFDDSTLVFDAYDSDVDSTLQKTKTLCYGKKDQSFTMSDAFVPFLDREFSSLLRNEAMSLAFAELKQVANQKAEQWAQRIWTKTVKSKRGADQDRRPIDDLPNYGRK